MDIPSFDSRRYPTSRLTSLHSYDDFPLIDDTLSFKLPRFRQYSGRLVVIRQCGWLLWSPNSSQTPYYPGMPPIDFQLACPQDERQRRYDGHLGRFDPTISPQVLSDGQPWRGFILRPVSKHALDLPEFSLLHQNWQSMSMDEGTVNAKWVNALMFRLNGLDAEMGQCHKIIEHRPDLWAARPQYPTVDEVIKLRLVRKYSVAVDAVARIQRGIKDRAAWLLMIRLLLSEESFISPEEARWGFVPPACDDYLGTWINGSHERDALWAMRKGMPCFVIHELVGPERHIIKSRQSDSKPDFLSGTDAVALHVDSNGFDHIARRSGHRPTTNCLTSTAPSRPLRLDSSDRKLSCPVVQGWTKQTIGKTAPSMSTTEACPDFLALADNKVAVDPTEGLDPNASPFAALPLEHQELDPSRVPWLKPPPVCSVPVGKKWEKWVCETTDEGKTFMKCLGRKGKHKRWTYYDRENLRELSFSKKIDLPVGLVSDIQTFGLPAPPMLYLVELDNRWRQRRASRWLYRTRDEPRKAGTVAPVPEVTLLPFKDTSFRNAAVTIALTSSVQDISFPDAPPNRPTFVSSNPERMADCVDNFLEGIWSQITPDHSQANCGDIVNRSRKQQDNIDVSYRIENDVGRMQDDEFAPCDSPTVASTAPNTENTLDGVHEYPNQLPPPAAADLEVVTNSSQKHRDNLTSLPPVQSINILTTPPSHADCPEPHLIHYLHTETQELMPVDVFPITSHSPKSSTSCVIEDSAGRLSNDPAVSTEDAVTNPVTIGIQPQVVEYSPIAPLIHMDEDIDDDSVSLGSPVPESISILDGREEDGALLGSQSISANLPEDERMCNPDEEEPSSCLRVRLRGIFEPWSVIKHALLNLIPTKSIRSIGQVLFTAGVDKHTIWLSTASTDAAVMLRGYLADRNILPRVRLNCRFTSQAAHHLAACSADHQWMPLDECSTPSTHPANNKFQCSSSGLMICDEGQLSSQYYDEYSPRQQYQGYLPIRSTSHKFPTRFLPYTYWRPERNQNAEPRTSPVGNDVMGKRSEITDYRAPSCHILQRPHEHPRPDGSQDLCQVHYFPSNILPAQPSNPTDIMQSSPSLHRYPPPLVHSAVLYPTLPGFPNYAGVPNTSNLVRTSNYPMSNFTVPLRFQTQLNEGDSKGLTQPTVFQRLGVKLGERVFGGVDLALPDDEQSVRNISSRPVPRRRGKRGGVKHRKPTTTGGTKAFEP